MWNIVWFSSAAFSVDDIYILKMSHNPEKQTNYACLIYMKIEE